MVIVKLLLLLMSFEFPDHDRPRPPHLCVDSLERGENWEYTFLFDELRARLLISGKPKLALSNGSYGVDLYVFSANNNEHILRHLEGNLFPDPESGLSAILIETTWSSPKLKSLEKYPLARAQVAILRQPELGVFFISKSSLSDKALSSHSFIASQPGIIREIVTDTLCPYTLMYQEAQRQNVHKLLANNPHDFISNIVDVWGYTYD